MPFIISLNKPYFNTLGGALAVAADGIWDGEVWLHGAIGWRMPLSGWRAAYTGDALGWHDRARTHFNAYAASQVTEVPNRIQLLLWHVPKRSGEHPNIVTVISAVTPVGTIRCIIMT